jgi:hypothetical protein
MSRSDQIRSRPSPIIDVKDGRGRDVRAHTVIGAGLVCTCTIDLAFALGSGPGVGEAICGPARKDGQFVLCLPVHNPWPVSFCLD